MPYRLPPLNALRAFEAAARHLSFARAAEELNVTPAAVSQQVKQLEGYLGATLFRRGKGLTLSEAGSAALPLLSEGFAALARGAERLRPGRDEGPLVISAPPTFAARWLIARLEDFEARHPEIELRLQATRRLVDFEMEGVDVAVRFGSGPYTGLHADRLMPEAIVPVAAPALAATLQAPADLLHTTLLSDDARGWDPTFPDWETWLASLGVEGRPRIRHYGDSNLVIEAVGAGLGVALVWHSLVADELRAGHLVRLFDSALPTGHGYHLVVPEGRLHVGKIAAFRHWMLAQAEHQLTL